MRTGTWQVIRSKGSSQRSRRLLRFLVWMAMAHTLCHRHASLRKNKLDAELLILIKVVDMNGNEIIEFPEFIASITRPTGGFTLSREENELIAQYQLISSYTTMDDTFDSWRLDAKHLAN
ncbi:hypothetical protein GJ496_011343 [Pomphorhynchus laevis]|nr:hypothetical protein GJ496_011343 [Pomphorhynchus laevis]